MDVEELLEFLKGYFAECGGRWTGMTVRISDDQIVVTRGEA